MRSPKPAPRRRAVIVATVVLAGCRDVSSSVVPETPLGRVARDWLAAHNRDEGHAMVHFTMENRGSGPMTGGQMDSIVYAGVRLADSVGRLVPVKTLKSSDSTLSVLFRSADGGTWTAQFTPVVQPSLVKVAVTVNRIWIYHGGSSLVDSVPDSR
jgi:hypothetical protein